VDLIHSNNEPPAKHRDRYVKSDENDMDDTSDDVSEM